MHAKAIDLLHAYIKNALAPQGGFLACGIYPFPNGPVRYTVARLRSVQSVRLDRNAFTLQAEGELLETDHPAGTKAALPAPITAPLTVPLTEDRNFAFYFPAGPAAAETLYQFLQRTFSVESGVSPDDGARAARAIVSRFTQSRYGGA